MKKYLVGIDVGTSSCKTCVFDFDGNMLGIASGEYPGYYPNPGWVELKEEDMLPQIFNSCRNAIIASNVEPHEIAAVSIGTIAAVTVMTDENNKPLYNFLSWQDTRVIGTDSIPKLLAGVSPEKFYEITGHPPTPFVVIPSKYIWLKDNKPEVFEKTAHVCTYQDYINKVFGADGYYTDKSSAGRYCLSDTNGDDVEWSQIILDAIGIRKEQLPEIIAEPGKIIGYISEEVAQVTGLPVGCPLCLGAHDQDCGTLGSGGNREGVAIMTLGTLGSCSIISNKSIRVSDASLISNAKQGMNRFVVERLGESSASSFRWFKEALCEGSKIENSSLEVTFGMITSAANFVPPGSNGVSFIPNLNHAKGAFLGISLGTKREDLARAVMEGITFEMQENIEIEMKAGINLEEIRLAGGVAKSDIWCQMLADIFQKNIHINECGEVGCLGAAIFAGVGSGNFRNIDEAVEKMVRFKKVFLPNKDQVEPYEDAYHTWIERKNKVF